MELPHSEESERALLCSVLLEPELINRIPDESIFNEVNHRILFKYLRNNTSIVDYSTLLASISQSDLIEIGGKEYLSSLYAYVPSSANWSHYLAVLTGLSDKRQAIIKAQKIIELSHERDSKIDEIESLAKTIRASVSKAEDTALGEDISRNLSLWMEQVYSGEIVDNGIEWGFEGLGKLIDKLRPGNLCLIGGRPGSGKTSLANSTVSLYCIPKGVPTLIYSLEMSEREETLRLVSIAGRIHLSRLQSPKILTPSDFSQLAIVLEKIFSSKIGIIDDTLSIHDIFSRSRIHKEKHGLDLIVIDHVQLVKYKNADTKERREALDEIGRISKEMAKNLECAVMLLTQINREDGSPFECSSLEAHADQFIIVPQTEADETTKELRVRKNRNGPVGLVEVKWFGPCAAFY